MRTTIDTYITNSILTIQDFKEFWQEKHEQEPLLFPLEVDSGDWQDYFTMWLESRK